MGKQKKVNPRRKPCTESEAAKQADDAFWLAIAIMLLTVIDTGRFDKDEIKELWDKINYNADSIAKGYINLYDICKTLNDDYDITIGCFEKLRRNRC